MRPRRVDPGDTFETIFGSQHDPNEVQANAFAAEFLAPATGVRERIDREPTLEDVVGLAAEYGMSTIAALYRLNTLGLTQRFETLEKEIDGGEHEHVWDRIYHPEDRDLIAKLDGHLPRLSPQLAGSALDSLLRHESDVAAVAHATGCPEDALAGGAGLIDV